LYYEYGLKIILTWFLQCCDSKAVSKFFCRWHSDLIESLLYSLFHNCVKISHHTASVIW